MEISVRKDTGDLIVSVAGRIDTVSASDFQQRMEELLDQEVKRIVLDLEKVEYVSSAGLRSVLVAAKKAQAEGRTLLCCRLQGMVKKVFDISGFSAMIPICDSLEEALSQE
jgi:anti-anti-sigma factor